MATQTTLTLGEYQVLPIEAIAVEPGFNNRRSVGNIDELAASIKSVGLLQPLLVRPVQALDDGPLGYLIIAGHRRLAACKKAELTQVPAIVVDQDEKSRLESLLVENLHRLDIDPLEEADGYRRLIAFGLSQKEIADKVGRSQAHVSKRVGLLGLVPDAVNLLNSGGIAIDKAIELAKVAPELQAEILKREKQHQYGGDREIFRYASPAQVARQITEERALAQRKKDSVAQAKKDGVQLLKGQVSDYGWYGRSERPLGDGPDGIKVGLKEHRKLECHRGYIDRLGHLKYACADPASHMDKKAAAKFKEAATKNDHSLREAERKAQARQLAAIKVDREKVVIEALAKLDPTAARRFALESFLIHKVGHGYERTRPGAVLHLVGEDAEAKNQLKRLYDYTNKSEANLLRASVALGYILGVEALERDQTYDQHGVAYAGTFDWLKSIGYQATELEAAFLERVTTQGGEVEIEEIAQCRICGCTDEQACEGGCSWVADPASDLEGEGELCSRCLGQALLEAREDHEGPLAGDITDDEAAEYLGLTVEDARKVLAAKPADAIRVPDSPEPVIEDYPEEERAKILLDTAATVMDSADHATGQHREDLEAKASELVDEAKVHATCRQCGCHGDCVGGCDWTEMVDIGFLCSSCDGKQIVESASTRRFRA